MISNKMHVVIIESDGGFDCFGNAKGESIIMETLVAKSSKHDASRREQYRTALEMYQRCKATDTWPAYGGGVMHMHLPEWIYKKHEGEKK